VLRFGVYVSPSKMWFALYLRINSNSEEEEKEELKEELRRKKRRNRK
jgi:hypothetical protein